MELANNAFQIFRQGNTFRDITTKGVFITTKCLHLSDALSKCVLDNKLNLLDHQSVRDTCLTQQWKNECPGTVRRNQFETLYRKTINRRLYTQDQLDKYMKSKNNFQHYGAIDHRY